jgi:hypothetical protein
MLWMTDKLFEGLRQSPVTVYADSARVGIMDEYGRARSEQAVNWRAR